MGGEMRSRSRKISEEHLQVVVEFAAFSSSCDEIGDFVTAFPLSKPTTCKAAFDGNKQRAPRATSRLTHQLWLGLQDSDYFAALVFRCTYTECCRLQEMRIYFLALAWTDRSFCPSERYRFSSAPPVEGRSYFLVH